MYIVKDNVCLYSSLAHTCPIGDNLGAVVAACSEAVFGFLGHGFI